MARERRRLKMERVERRDWVVERKRIVMAEVR